MKSGEATKESKETNNNEQKVEIVTNGLNTKESKPEPEKHDQQVLDPDLLSQIDWKPGTKQKKKITLLFFSRKKYNIFGKDITKLDQHQDIYEKRDT